MQQVTVEHTKFGYQVRVDGELVASKGSKAEADEIAGRLRGPGGIVPPGSRDMAIADGATLAFIAEEGDTADDGAPIPPGTPVFEVDEAVLGTSDIAEPSAELTAIAADPTILVDPEDLGPIESAVVTRVSVSELLAGTVPLVAAALATETWDDLLDDLDQAERAGKDRKGVHEAIAARRAVT